MHKSPAKQKEQRRHKKTAENKQVIQSGLRKNKSKTRNKVTEVNMKTRTDTGQ